MKYRRGARGLDKNDGSRNLGKDRAKASLYGRGGVDWAEVGTNGLTRKGG